MINKHTITIAMMTCILASRYTCTQPVDFHSPVMIVMASRHGARMPHNDTISLPWSLGRGLSQITTEGKLQQYILGQIIRLEYPSLFNDLYIQADEYTIKSSLKPRTIDSSYEVIKGISDSHHGPSSLSEVYLRSAKPPFTSNHSDAAIYHILASTATANISHRLSHPVYVHTPAARSVDGHEQAGDVADGLDDDAGLLLYETLGRSRGAFWRYSEELRGVLNLTGGIDFTLMKVVGDTLISDYFHRPDSHILDMNSLLGKYLININTVSHLLKFVNESSLRKPIDNFANDIQDIFMSKISKMNESHLKFALFSMHDTDMSPLLINLGILNFDCNLRQISSYSDLGCEQKPNYSSSLIFELVKDMHDHFVVYSRYNGQYIDVCAGVVPPPTAKVPCKIDIFLERMKSTGLSLFN